MLTLLSLYIVARNFKLQSLGVYTHVHVRTYISSLMKCRHAQIQGDNAVARDFGAVQRGDAEMEQKMNRVLRACVEMRRENIIASIHDQGAGGNGTCRLLHFAGCMCVACG